MKKSFIPTTLRHFIAAGFTITCLQTHAQAPETVPNTPITAPTTTPTPPISIDANQKTTQIKKLFDTMQIGKSLEQVLPRIKQALFDKYINQNMSVAERNRQTQRIEAYWQTILGEVSWQKVEPLALPAFEQHLTLADIEILNQFYQTSLGLKVYQQGIDSIFEMITLEQSPEKLDDIQKAFLTAKPFKNKEAELAYTIATSLIINEANQNKLEEESAILARAFLYQGLMQHFKLDELNSLMLTIKEPAFSTAYHNLQRANLAFNQIYLEHLIGVVLKSDFFKAESNAQASTPNTSKSKSGTSESKLKTKNKTKK